MKEFFIGFLVGIVLTAATGGYFVLRKNKNVRHAQDVTASAIQHAAGAVEAKLVACHLTGDDIQKELTDTGKVVRRQMSDFGAAVADVDGESRIVEVRRHGSLAAARSPGSMTAKVTATPNALHRSALKP